MRVALTAAALVALMCGACASHAGHEVDAGPPQTIDASVMLQPGYVLEGSWVGGPNDSMSLSLTMNNPVLDWDIHTHDNGATQTYIVEFSVATASYTLDPSHDTTWYLLVKNSGSATEQLQATLEITAGTTWSGWPQL